MSPIAVRRADRPEGHLCGSPGGAAAPPGTRRWPRIPVVLEVKTDPEVPPLPPHITLEQAKEFSIALVKGDPDEVGVIRGAARQVLGDHPSRQGLKSVRCG